MKTLNFTNTKLMTNLLILILIASFSCSSDDSNNNTPDNPITEEFTASFKLMGDGYDETINYNSEDNLIFCRRTGDEIWIRFAQNRFNDGNTSPHIDIDICNYVGTGTYTPVDPQNRPCPEGLLWDIFWHDGNKIYSNKGDSQACELTVSQEGDIITGTFSCSEVIRFQGTQTIEITEGQFTCKIE